MMIYIETTFMRCQLPLTPKDLAQPKKLKFHEANLCKKKRWHWNIGLLSDVDEYKSSRLWWIPNLTSIHSRNLLYFSIKCSDLHV